MLWEASGLPSQETPSALSQWPEEIPLVVRRWMASRGFPDYASFQSFSEYSLKNLKNPSSLKDMDLAVDRLIQAYERKEKVCLYADFDMDGTPGLALLIRGLQHCGFENLLSFQPNRFDDGYGVHPDIIEDFITNHGISLFVTVDVGITDVDAVDLAGSYDVDFIITDHHQAKAELPAAHAIVNPNQPGCPSGLGHLCGTGVAFYLVLALRRAMTDRGLLKKSFDPKKLLDCFAIGTLTDMVPLIEDNRPLVQHGLLQLARTDRGGLRHLMGELNLFGKGLTSSDVSIQLAPKLNALGRMNSEVQALDLFLVTDAKEAESLVRQTLLAQKKRTEIQKEAEDQLQSVLVAKTPLKFVFEYNESFYKGIVGLLAMRASQNHDVPSFVGSVIEDKIVGSARAPKGESLLEAFEYCKATLNQFGGHHQAAGFELELANAEAFNSKLAEFYADRKPVKKVMTYDLKAELAELDDQFKHWFKKLEPYGVGFPIPLIRMDHLFVASTRVLKEKHLKLVLKDIDGNKIDGLWFFADNIEEKRQLTSKRVSVIVEPSINFYMGQESLQTFIRDLKIEY